VRHSIGCVNRPGSTGLPDDEGKPMGAAGFEWSEFQRIPGVGPKLAAKLAELGVQGLDDLAGRSPEALYRQLGDLRQAHIDRCVLYVFRCAVYFAKTPNPDAEKLKWWAWKDKTVT